MNQPKKAYKLPILNYLLKLEILQLLFYDLDHRVVNKKFKKYTSLFIYVAFFISPLILVLENHFSWANLRK